MPLLSVQDLRIHFPVRGGWFGRATDVIKAVDKVSFDVEEGSTVGLVGESGSGKSTVARALLKLLPVTSGSVKYRDREILTMPESEFRPLRKEMQMVFQDPIGSLNPRMTVESILAEPLQIHFPEKTRDERREVSSALLKKVGLPDDSLQRYPHEFSGGQRQRIGIARALAVQPKFLICDEPVSALDVSVQAQILNLLKDLQEEFQLTLLFIAHDLAVVRHMSDRIVVMHHGKIVEQGDAEQVCEHPRHDYTQKLLDAVPVLS
ncbi:MAG: ABC transporter ATP-binding protein [Prosthecobacter sp.]|jgi:ABC-type oligopeptide transport system ATPase subunit|uniref:ABC transporter ATP-binding protein n=1 Tax=Prosthecobacter sp. TaxID=1965333 RepID=UPI0019F7E7F3|nr:ATP-binding cassette domain-containing protein [Prosthecobacter sp.]MBE2282200.1 ABC transporter ATP-binding protein [Prosthecobacter sp.]